jgi:hypothetical protein
MTDEQESHQCYRIAYTRESENAAAERKMAKQAVRAGDASDGVVPRSPSLRSRLKKLVAARPRS